MEFKDLSNKEPSRSIIAHIDLSSIVENLISLRNRSKKEIWAVVKANAYGHGAVEVAQSLEKHAFGFCVSSVDEALELRGAGITKPILVLAGSKEENWLIASRHRLTLAVVSPEQLAPLVHFTKSNPLSLHLKIDSGMGRLGILPEELSNSKALLQQLDSHITGIMSHFSTAGDDPSFLLHQQEIFSQSLMILRSFGVKTNHIHHSNTDAAVSTDLSYESHLRIGLGLYGLSNTDAEHHLRPCLSLKCEILRIKDVPPGTPIGYGRTYVTPGYMKILTLGCGYADGYRREFSNKAFVEVEHQEFPIVGRVSMDFLTIGLPINTMINHSSLVTLISDDPKSKLSLKTLSRIAGILPYEITCGLHRRVTRRYTR